MAFGPYIGCLLSVTAKSEQRYEGILQEIQMESSSITLNSVRCFGTEDRTPPPGHPPSTATEGVYPSIKFHAQDIKELDVKDEHPFSAQPAADGQPGGAAPAPSNSIAGPPVPQEAAAGPYGNPQPPVFPPTQPAYGAAPFGTQVQPSWGATTPPQPYPQQPNEQLSDPRAQPPPGHTPPTHPQAPTLAPIGPATNTGAANTVQAPKPAPTVPLAAQAVQRPPQTSKISLPAATPAATATTATAPATAGASAQQPAKQAWSKVAAKAPSGRTPSATPSQTAAAVAAATAPAKPGRNAQVPPAPPGFRQPANQAGQGRGRGRAPHAQQASSNRPAPAPPVPVPDAEFNFAEHNRKFDKEKLAKEAPVTAAAENGQLDDDLGFFDKLTVVDTRPDGGGSRMADQRRIDMETFGGTGIARRGGYGRGRGRGRGGGRGRGRGGRGENSGRGRGDSRGRGPRAGAEGVAAH